MGPRFPKQCGRLGHQRPYLYRKTLDQKCFQLTRAYRAHGIFDKTHPHCPRAPYPLQ